MRSMGLDVEAKFVWKEGYHVGITIGVYIYFLLTFLYGLWLKEGNVSALKKIFKHPGRAIADFVIMDGPGVTLMNMALLGIFAETYVLRRCLLSWGKEGRRGYCSCRSGT